MISAMGMTFGDAITAPVCNLKLGMDITFPTARSRRCSPRL